MSSWSPWGHSWAVSSRLVSPEIPFVCSKTALQCALQWGQLFPAVPQKCVPLSKLGHEHPRSHSLSCLSRGVHQDKEVVDTCMAPQPPGGRTTTSMCPLGSSASSWHGVSTAREEHAKVETCTAVLLVLHYSSEPLVWLRLFSREARSYLPFAQLSFTNFWVNCKA